MFSLNVEGRMKVSNAVLWVNKVWNIWHDSVQYFYIVLDDGRGELGSVISRDGPDIKFYYQAGSGYPAAGYPDTLASTLTFRNENFLIILQSNVHSEIIEIR